MRTEKLRVLLTVFLCTLLLCGCASGLPERDEKEASPAQTEETGQSETKKTEELKKESEEISEAGEPDEDREEKAVSEDASTAEEADVNEDPETEEQAMTRRLAAPRAAVNVWPAALNGQHGAVVIEQMGVWDALQPQAGVSTLTCTRFTEKQHGATLVDDGGGMD